jgi:CrcB protein
VWRITDFRHKSAIRHTQVSISPYWRLFFAVGFVGGYTTFSTFEYESIRPFQDGELLLSGNYLLGSVIAGGIAAIAGIALGTWV